MRPTRNVLISAALATLVALPGVAGGQQCITYESPLIFDSTSDCQGNNNIPRAFMVDVMRRGSRDYLVVDIGNNIRLWDVTSPQNPGSSYFSLFGYNTPGDADYDLVRFTVCDDCRYGVASFEQATVIFDMGVAPAPSFRTFELYTDPKNAGGLTFTHAGTQYLMAGGMGGSCPSGDGSPVYIFNSVLKSQLTQVACAEAPGQRFPPTPNGGASFTWFDPQQQVTRHFLYAIDKSDLVQIFEVTGSGGTDLAITWFGTFAKATTNRGLGLRVDAANELAVSADSIGGHVWDISDPTQPTEVATLPPGPFTRNVVAIASPYVWHARKANEDAATYDISDPSNPVELDPGFWDPTQVWNDMANCVWDIDATFSPDGVTLYVGRWAVVQMFDFSQCATPAPTAGVTVTPSTVFPDDTAIVSDDSTGYPGTEYALWVSGSSDPTAAAIWGSRAFSSTVPADIQVDVPIHVAADVEYWAHAAVRSAAYPCDLSNPTSCGDRLAMQEIAIDRTPIATITVDPEVAITDDTVTLSATAQGTPSTGGPGDPFAWTITSPTGAYDATASGSTTPVTLAEPGLWQFDLDVMYEHEAEIADGTDHVAEASRSVDISSVSADFTISPPDPCHDQGITLDGSVSRTATGAALSHLWEITGATTYGDCPSSVECSIPGLTLNPGAHTATLTLTNTDNSDQSVRARSFTVTDCTADLDFSWTPQNPAVGETVLFSVEGTSRADITYWDLGGASCSSPFTTTSCEDGPLDDCLQQSWRYATDGLKTVTLSAKIGATTYGPVSHMVTVSSTGSCGSCYVLPTPDSTDADWGGETGSFTVNTNPDCAWTARSDEPWISITGGASGTGTGAVDYSVADNTCLPRTGTITVSYSGGEETFLVTQPASPLTIFCDGFEIGNRSAWSGS